MLGVFTAFGHLPLLAASVLGGASYRVLPADLSTPTQQRVAISGPNSMSIGWNTYQHLDKPCVNYGNASDKLEQQACSTWSVTYPSSRTWSNSVTLENLTAATTYYYQIASTNSTVEHFLSPRTPGDKTPFTMNAVIDLGVYGEDGFTIEGDHTKRDTIPQINPALNHTTIGALARSVDDYELVIHPGDFGYADDWYLKPKNALDAHDAYEAILENFYDQLAPVAGRKPYMASPGNHESACEEVFFAEHTCPDGQKNFTDFMNRFGHVMPPSFTSTSNNTQAKVLANKARELSNPPFWYSFEYGMVHVTMINTETDFPQAPMGPEASWYNVKGGPFGALGQQLEFLEMDLASVDRDVTPWLIVAGHRPWYTTSGGASCAPCQTAFETTMYKYAVDLGVFGHVHNHQRFLPMFAGTVDPKGLNDPDSPMYIIAGGSGNIEGLSKIGSNTTGNAFAYADTFTYGTISILDEQHMRVECVESATGKVLDSATLFKSHGESFPKREAPSPSSPKSPAPS